MRIQEECEGVIPFDCFMREALYHPNLGYYSAKIADVGPKGDFSTSATLGNQLGAAIAGWILKKVHEAGWRTIPILEVGAGNGSLAKTVLNHLGWKNRIRIRYSIVETSPVLIAHQKKALRFRRVRWHSSVSEALQQSSGRALIFSNELVDAFPCRLFEKGLHGWNEVGVQLSSDGSLHEVLIPLIGEDVWFRQFEDFRAGQRIVRHDSFKKWLHTWRSGWREGAMLTIDYGSSDFSKIRPSKEGTLRAFWKHRRFTGAGLYARFGKQDLTADVNFADLIRWGDEAGWQTLSLQSQSSFAMMHADPREVTLDTRFTDPEDVGGAFLVLEQIRQK